MTLPLPVLEDPCPPRPGVLDVSAEEWCAWLSERNEKPLRAKQIRRWLLTGGAESFDAMTNLPKALRTELDRHFNVWSSRLVRHLEADDGTHKLL
ncbi:MAG: hypothetical protein NZO58_14300, partial [Gemmataceae bacterium]|nr:hypothetical protein [Gemmataceae bacterium]